MITILNIDEHIANQTIQFPDTLVKFGDLLSINQTNLSEDFAKHSARLAWINMLAAQAKAAYEEKRSEAKRMYAKCDKEARDDLIGSSIKPTEKQVENMVRLDPDYITAEKAENDALYQYEMLQGFARALYQRGELLQSLGAMYRQERQFEDLSMKIRPHRMFNDEGDEA